MSNPDEVFVVIYEMNAAHVPVLGPVYATEQAALEAAREYRADRTNCLGFSVRGREVREE
jgi:hypothetical protein